MTITQKNNLLHLLPITTSRLRLVNMDQKYAQAICDGFTPEVESFMFMTTTKSLEEVNEYINETIHHNEIGKSFELVITDLDDNFVGVCGLFDTLKDTPSFSIWLQPSSWGRGYGKEALKAIYEAVKEQQIYKEFIYPVRVDNEASIALAESLGGKESPDSRCELAKPDGRKALYTEFIIK